MTITSKSSKINKNFGISSSAEGAIRFTMRLISLSILSLAAGLTIARNFSNPIRVPGADPHIVTTGGYYYLTNTQTTHISVTRSTTLGGLLNGDTRTVWSDTNPDRNQDIWAPEMHFIDGIWYIFYTAGNGDIGQGQRSFVLKGCDINPYDCNYTFLAELMPAAGGQGGPKLETPWSIDGTYLTIGAGRYHVVSAINQQGIQSIQIAELDTQTWTVSPWSIISSPTEPWEMADAVSGEPAAVNEGPNALYHNGSTWLSFSASWCGTPAYTLGLLHYVGSGDPLNALSWEKSGPVLSSANGNYGTGHNVFFLSPDGTEVWNAYHATNNSAGSCGGDRYTMAQIVNFDVSGNPDLGVPVNRGSSLKVPSGDGS
ncbi:glycosyl hydrolase [Talaromyces proteolyticus]|uniref:Glycosyl hydrolase n=1 Tax=Talaromyces proteolyticus TaxID=1131652 RepID=A0AAD4PU50_9EURO|nr:glycosyl hydrolase [Talaromyces proteolyticus]KAH8694193.1 glycosyl hydrolase [Talaromyces proteolyticus]